MKSKVLLSFFVILISFQVLKASTPKTSNEKKSTKGLIIEVVPVADGKYNYYVKVLVNHLFI